MSMYRSRIAWFVSFVLTLTLAVWMLSLELGWVATLSAAAATLVVGPFFIWEGYAAVVLWRFYRGLHKDFGR